MTVIKLYFFNKQSKVWEGEGKRKVGEILPVLPGMSRQRGAEGPALHQKELVGVKVGGRGM